MNERIKNIIGTGAVFLLLVGLAFSMVMALLFPPPPEQFLEVCVEQETVVGLSYAPGGAGTQAADGGIVMAPIGGGQAFTAREQCVQSKRVINPEWTQWQKDQYNGNP